jgi:hypothetical protein
MAQALAVGGLRANGPRRFAAAISQLQHGAPKMPDFAGKKCRIYWRSVFPGGWQTPKKQGIKPALATR